ncbi:MAG: glycoside hydrolase family 28 protein, partial [Clostridia bacterium]|nr:glycoside hydrolase family 28 protein [Clostridia bacterium]
MLKKLFVSGTTACFEFDNTNPYYNPNGKYTVFLNGVKVSQSDANVFSVFNLTPDTEYSVSVSCEEGSLSFRTDKETGVVDVKALGAKGDGKADDTYYVQMAIDSCPAGGRVHVPEGTYYVRPIVLRSNVTLELAKGATILGSVKEEDYPYIPARIYGEDGKEIVM